MNTSKIVCTNRPVGRAVALLLAMGGVAASTGAFGAETAALEEIVVTAERRETALQDTPMSVMALSAEGLEAKGVDDLMELSDFTPNLSIKGGRTGGNNAPVFSIRGIGGGGGATGERGVALYIDGIYVPRTSGSVFKVFDIERAEVLRGPQGTLFGRNSEGGAIRLFTQQPTHEFDAYVRGTLGNYDQDISAHGQCAGGRQPGDPRAGRLSRRGRLREARHAGAGRQQDHTGTHPGRLLRSPTTSS